MEIMIGINMEMNKLSVRLILKGDGLDIYFETFNFSFLVTTILVFNTKRVCS